MALLSLAMLGSKGAHTYLYRTIMTIIAITNKPASMLYNSWAFICLRVMMQCIFSTARFSFFMLTNSQKLPVVVQHKYD
eukprot:8265938-Pyramimonas_sp.AAC.1